MSRIEWAEIQDVPQRLASGRQTLTITNARTYRNLNGHWCLKLKLKDRRGGAVYLCYSIQPEHRAFIELMFLRPFIGMNYNEVLGAGGWETLIGRELEVDVDYPDGRIPRLQPI